MKHVFTLCVILGCIRIVHSQPASPIIPENEPIPHTYHVILPNVPDTVPGMSDTKHSLSEVVVSANRFEQKRKDVAQPTEIISAQELAFDNLQTSADVMQNTGNILVQKSQQGGGSPVIRGFETNKVLLVIDGVRMNNAIYRAGHLQNIITLDNAVMRRVEILYGPGSVMYGSDALGGVMHFYTKNPILSTNDDTEVHANAFVRYGSANAEKTGHIDVSLGGATFGSLTSFTYSDFGDLVQGDNRRDEYPDFGLRPNYAERQNGEDVVVTNDDPNKQVGSGYAQYDFLQKFVFQPGSEVSHKFNFQYSTSSDVNRYDRLTQTQNGNLRFGEWYYGPQKRLFGSYTMSLSKGDGLFDNGNIILAYQNIEESRHDRRLNSPNLNHRIEQLDILTLNADFHQSRGSASWSYGLEGTYNDVTSTANVENIETGVTAPLDTRYPDGGSQMGTAAVYVSNTYKVTPHFLLNGGIRASYNTLKSTFIDKTFFPFPFDEASQSNAVATGSLGTVLTADSGWRLSFQAATGYRSPSVDDMSKVFESVPGTVIVPNPDLGPEHTNNLDMTLSKSVDNKYEIGVGGYYTWLRNAITVQPGTFNGASVIVFDGDSSQVITNVNANKAYIYGFNAYLSLELNRNLSLNSTINYTYGRIKTDTTDTPLDHIPPVFGKTSLNYQQEKFRGEIYAIYHGWKRLEDYNLLGEDNIAFATADGMPSWMTLNIKAAYAVSDYLTIQAGVENIMDTNYRVFASNISAPGRNISVTLRASW